MKTKGILILLLGLAVAACYSLTPQDRAAEAIDDTAQAAAYRHLCAVGQLNDGGGWDDDAGDIANARQLIRAAHAGSSAILRRNGVDAGAAPLVCP